MREENWVALPIVGSRLVRCTLESSGKDGSILLEVDGFPKIEFGLSRSVRFSSLDGIRQKLVALDDNWVQLVLEPREDVAVRIVEAAIDFWLTDDLDDCTPEKQFELATTPKRLFSGSHAACFDFRLGFQVS